MDDRIDRLQRVSATKPDVFCLAGGLPAEELFPKQRLALAFVRAVNRSGSSALQYGWPEGSEGLRGWIAERLRLRGARIAAEDVIVTSGAQQALAITVQMLTLDDERIGVDAESYPGALDLFRARGAEPVVETGEEDTACSYVVTGASNPRGLGVDAARRAALLASGRVLIVDEAYAELRFDGLLEQPFLVDARDRVFHIGTFSKTLCPGLRVGWLVPPPALRGRALELKREIDLQAGSLAQGVLESYLAEDEFDARLRRARKTYAVRAARLARALRRELPEARFVEPEGGFSIFVETDLEDVDEARALAIATRRGVSFDPASIFRADAAPSPLGMRLSCSRLSGGAIDEAVHRLAGAIDEIRRELPKARRAPHRESRQVSL